MPSLDFSTARCWKWLIFSGSVSEKTPPTPAFASASVIWPSESSCTCWSFSLVFIRASRASTFFSIFRSAATRDAARALLSLGGATGSFRVDTRVPRKMMARMIAAVVMIRVTRFMGDPSRMRSEPRRRCANTATPPSDVTAATRGCAEFHPAGAPVPVAHAGEFALSRVRPVRALRRPGAVSRSRSRAPG